MKSASVEPRSCVSSAPQILAFPGPRSHVATGVPLTLSCGRSSCARPSRERDDLPEGLTAQRPPWWKPGKPLTRPVEEVIEMLMGDDKEDGEVVPGAGAGDSGGAEEPKHEPGEEPDGQDEDQPGKRPHVVVDRNGFSASKSSCASVMDGGSHKASGTLRFCRQNSSLGCTQVRPGSGSFESCVSGHALSLHVNRPGCSGLFRLMSLGLFVSLAPPSLAPPWSMDGVRLGDRDGFSILSTSCWIPWGCVHRDGFA